ncbi:MAG: glycoside hydrolase family 31 protein [Lachnospiraceae bacterium]|nr:glycoside hydrolase family 31 protein [Lachnospiraceae bacterium]
MAGITYRSENNTVHISNGQKTKSVEFIHDGLLRIYETKNSEELVKLNYRNEDVLCSITTLCNNLILHFGNCELLVDENLTLRLMRNGQPYFEEYDGEDAVVYEVDKEFDLAKLEGHKTEETLADFKAQMTFRLFDNGDKIYGLGDKAAHLNRRDFEYISWNTDDPTQHNETYKSLYKSITYLMVNHHQTSYYGIFYPSSYKCVINLGKYNKKFMYIGTEKGEYDYFLFIGDTPAEITKNYTELVGRSLFTPMKFLGYHASRWSYTEEEMQELRRVSVAENMPLDYIHMDIDYMDHYKVYTVSDDYLSDAKKLVKDFAEDGIAFIPIIDPAVKLEEGYPLYDTLTANHGFATRNGEDYVNVVWPGDSKYPNYFDEKTAEYLTGVTEKFLKEYGFAGIWCDMNEPASFNGPLPEDVEFRVRDKVYYHDEVHNLYAEGMVKCIAKAFTKNNLRPAVITRAAFATTSPYTTSWNGDNQSLWNHLENSLPQVMTMNMSGFVVNGVDIGGFGNECNKELLIRWIEANIFNPFLRNHSGKNSRYQEPQAFDEETVEIYRKFLNVRYEFLPYLYDLLRKAHTTGEPLYRPLYYDYPADENVKELNDEVMVGPSVLLAPIVHQGKKSRVVYLPEGKWVNYFTGEIYEGGKEYLVQMGLAETGLFIKAGAMIPMFANLLHINKKEITNLHLYLAPGADEAEYVHYEDDGETLDYQKGVYNEYRFVRKGNKLTMEMLHEGYASTYKKLVVRYGERARGLVFNKNMEIEL